MANKTRDIVLCYVIQYNKFTILCYTIPDDMLCDTVQFTMIFDTVQYIYYTLLYNTRYYCNNFLSIYKFSIAVVEHKTINYQNKFMKFMKFRKFKQIGC